MTITVLTAATQSVVIAGIDAHRHTRHVVVLDDGGLRIADQEFAATTPGYRDLLDWLTRFGLPARIGNESTGSYAAGLARYLFDAGIDVVWPCSASPASSSVTSTWLSMPTAFEMSFKGSTFCRFSV